MHQGGAATQIAIFHTNYHPSVGNGWRQSVGIFAAIRVGKAGLSAWCSHQDVLVGFVDSGLSGDHGPNPQKWSGIRFFGVKPCIVYRSFWSSSIMVQRKLKEKDWKRNHHFVKVRYWDVLDVFGTFQFQDIWYVYICGFISWPFVLVPPKSTFNLARFSLLSRKTAEAAPSLQQNLGTLAFHFQKKKGGSRMGFSTTKMEGLGSLQTSKR